MSYDCEWLESHMDDTNPPNFPCEWAKQNWDKDISEITQPFPCQSLYDKWHATKRTVLYNDGTFIINELSTNIEKNTKAHGTADYVYDPLDETHDYYFPTREDRPWESERLLITSAEVGSPVSPTSTAFWFAGMENCISIDLKNLDTSNAVYMNNMFGSCQALTNADVSHFDTSNAVTMRQMFYNCINLQAVDVSGFNTSKVTEMQQMFAYCYDIITLDVSHFDTSNVTNMGNMFNSCESLSELDVSEFNTSEVTSMSAMFWGCKKLISIDVSNFDTSNVTSFANMFGSCTSLRTIYASSLFVTDKETMNPVIFDNCPQLVGGAGTQFDSTKTGKTYARIDNPPTAPGYFTSK